MDGREARFWASVALVAVASVALFKLFAASKVGEMFPALRELAAFI